MTDSPTLALAKDLISRESVTPEDAGCQEVMIQRLKALGFEIEVMVYDDTTNFWARRGTESPLFAFAGHTDVVPAGTLEHWHTPPFEPTVI
ncbi:succinyl-diaminopimelate desuccinylase, partial [Vibrio genomosp. F10 str. 9ZD137]